MLTNSANELGHHFVKCCATLYPYVFFLQVSILPDPRAEPVGEHRSHHLHRQSIG